MYIAGPIRLEADMCLVRPTCTQVINNDPETKDLLRLYFLPDYNVTLAETIIPGGF
jgi:glucan phosphorylase